VLFRSRGILGIGKKNALVKLTALDEKYLRYRVENYVSSILKNAGFENFEFEIKEEESDVRFNIISDDSSLLIGRSALMLDSLQYLVDHAFRFSELPSKERILIDVDNYRDRVINPLKQKALRLANSVKRSGRPIKMPPMATILRREVHIVVKTVPGVSSVSQGDGLLKTLMIVSDKKPPYDSSRSSRPAQKKGYYRH
jgi:spoIIIJ-associated protein